MALLTCIGITPEAHSATYYLAPNGTNSNFTGSYDKPWRTFSFAIPKLQPGDTLILKDGTYAGWNSGYPFINCALNGVQNGTITSPITIKAQNERRAFLSGHGGKAAFMMTNCSYWNVQGLRAKSTDKAGATGSVSVFVVYKSKHVTFKRLLVTHNNRYANSHLLLLAHSTNILVEESEFYNFQRYAILNWHTNNSIFRRNYFNSRGYADVTGGWESLAKDRGDMGIVLYPGSHNIHENNVSENNLTGMGIQATSPSVNNRFFGNISLNDLHGFHMQARGNGDKMPMDTIIENHVSITPEHSGLWARSAKNTQVKNISVLGGRGGIVSDLIPNAGDGFYSFFSKNSLVSQTSGHGFAMIGQTEFSHKFPSVYNTHIKFYPNKNYFNEKTDDPKLGTCKVFIPKSSPRKGQGEGGTDIGANVLYRYKNGVLTNQPLWNTTTGAFPKGALVKGINDIPGSSLFDVHKRLNVNTNGCSLPY
jgi:hypothetical protein